MHATSLLYDTLGIITEITYRIRKIPELEHFPFFAFEDYIKAVNEIQKEDAAIFVVALFAGPKPKDVEGEAFVHIIVHDSQREAAHRLE